MVARSLCALERTCVVRGLAEARLRPDLRVPSEGREVRVVFDPRRRGAATVRIGTSQAFTEVLATVSASLVRPHADRPAEGAVHYHVEVAGCAQPVDDWAVAAATGGEASASGGAGAAVAAGAQSSSAASSSAATLAGDDERDALQRTVERVLKTGPSRFVDTSALCVLPGEAAWALRVDVCVLCADGALADAAVAAAVAALCDFRRQDHAVDAATGAVRVFTTDERHPVPLALGPVTLAATVLVVDPASAAETDATTRRARAPPESVAMLLDPSSTEEALLRSEGGRGVARVTAALSASPSAPGSITHLAKAGGEPVSARALAEHVVPLALSRVRAVAAAIDDALSQRPAY